MLTRRRVQRRHLWKCVLGCLPAPRLPLASQIHHASLSVLLCAPLADITGCFWGFLVLWLLFGFDEWKVQAGNLWVWRDSFSVMSLPCPPAPSGSGSYGETLFWGSSSDAAQQACSPPVPVPGCLNIPLSDHGSVCNPFNFYFTLNLF